MQLLLEECLILVCHSLFNLSSCRYLLLRYESTGGLRETKQVITSQFDPHNPWAKTITIVSQSNITTI